MKLAGKKALITGGNSGIGLGTARLFISEGAEVAITGRDQQTLDEAVAKLGSKAHGYRADVTVAEDRKKLFAELAKDFGELDIVFANAGISGRTPTGTTDEAIFEKVVRATPISTVHSLPSIQAAPLMKEIDNGSGIIFNGSVHTFIPRSTHGGVAAYAGAAKARTRSRWRDPSPQTLHPRKICSVNVVAPGATKTPIWKRGYTRQCHGRGIRESFRDFFSSTVPLARWGERRKMWPRLCFFFASDDLSYINQLSS